MPSATVKPTSTSVRWPVPAALAVAPLVLGILVSFSADHSARYGLVVLAILAGVTAIASILIAVMTPGAVRVAAMIKFVWGAVLGALCLLSVTFIVAPNLGGSAGGALTLQIAAVAVLVGFGIADLTTGLRERRADRFWRDWVTLGVLEILAGIVAVVVPSGYRLDYTVTDTSLPPVKLTLDAAVMVVGLLGAALAVIGVYLAISAVSLMGGRKKAQVTA